MSGISGLPLPIAVHRVCLDLCSAGAIQFAERADDSLVGIVGPVVLPSAAGIGVVISATTDDAVVSAEGGNGRPVFYVTRPSCSLMGMSLVCVVDSIRRAGDVATTGPDDRAYAIGIAGGNASIHRRNQRGDLHRVSLQDDLQRVAG